MLKKVIIGLQVVILVAMAFLFYKAYSNNEPEKYVFDDKGKAVSKVSDNDIIVYYNLDSLKKRSNFLDSLQTALDVSERYWKNNLESTKKSAEAWFADIQKRQLTVLEQQQAQGEYERRQKQMYDMQAMAEEKLMDLQINASQLLSDAIIKTANELNTRKKIKFVLAYDGKTNLVTPTSGAVDVTNDMVEIMNHIYKTKRK